jgi:hypothetical protein
VTGERSSTMRRAAPATVLGGLAILFVCWFMWWRSPPQMGADEEVFKTVDALFTAVTARDEKLLGDCERRLLTYKEAGKLPADAADYLAVVIRQSHEGKWEPAAERLYDFIREQRCEGERNSRVRK